MPPMSRRHTLLAFAAAAMLAVCLPAAAQSSGTQPAYKIEVIIFRALETVGAPEDWSAEATPNAAGNVAGGEASTGAHVEIAKFLAALPPSAYQLDAIESRLRTSGAYVPVAHVAWSQTASSWGTPDGFTLQQLGIDVPGLSGTIYLERGMFLHLGMSLSYAVPDPPPTLGAAPGTLFTINENRRIKFYDRNYYDHPAFGVIALVTPARGARPPGR